MADAAVETKLELGDIQALVLRAHAELPWAGYLFFHVADAAGARAALRRLLDERAITTAASVITQRHRRPGARLQVALSYAGLARLGVDAASRASFAPEFINGMAEPARARRLGDRAASAPERWELGGATHELDVLLGLFAATEPERDALAAHWVARLAPSLTLTLRQDATPRRGDREHFGFRDGISQPVLRGDPERDHVPEVDRIADGEFLFGYPNEYGKLPYAPRTAGGVDLGKNGTYLVFRKLEQDVAAFWRYFYDEAGGVPTEAERLAAKCMGRWPSGAPLSLSPHRDDPQLGADDAHNNHFLFLDDDALGTRCPVAAHIRRANPRDAKGDDKDDSLLMVRRRRIIRRGRPYGPPTADERPREHDGERRGLYFIALNTNLGRQFEFVQQTWLNNPKFGGLANDRDPVVAQDEERGAVSLPASPFRRRLAGLPSFITVRGGEYFFLPGLKALAHLLAACEQQAH